MFKVLNKLSWFASFLGGFFILFFIGIITGELSRKHGFLNSDTFLFWIIIPGIFSMIIKKIFLSENFIKENLGIIEKEFIFSDESKEKIKKNNEIFLENNDEDIVSGEANFNLAKEISKEKNKMTKKEENEFAKKAWEEKIAQIAKNNNEILEDKITEKEVKIDQKINEKDMEIKEIEDKIIKKEEKIENKIEEKQKNTFEKNEPNFIEAFFVSLFKNIKIFFSTNLLAKLGALLVFLAVVYFLKGVVGDFWEDIGPVGRLIIGIIVGFSTYFLGTKIYKKHKNEGIILIGTGILINYAVILIGRYLVGKGGYLGEGITFLFLVLNTLFAVLTAILYNSKKLLIFSFVFAYLIPFIIGAESAGNPYTLIGYSFALSLGGLFLAKKMENKTLLVISFIAGNFLFLIAPFSDSIGWIAKILLTAILSLISVKISYDLFIEKKGNKGPLFAFIGTYIFIIFNLINSTYLSGFTKSALSDNLSFLIYNIILLGLFIFSIKLISNLKKPNGISLLLLSAPLFILIGILFSGNLLFSPFVLIFTILFYLFGFVLLEGILTPIITYFFFGILAFFIFVFNINLIGSYGTLDLNLFEFLILIGTSLIFLFSSYFYSKKENLGKLYPIGTIGTILILLPILVLKLKYSLNGTIITIPINLFEYIISIISIFIFAFANIIMPFLNKNLLKKEGLNNLLAGTIIGAIFFAFQIYNYGEMYFPGVVEGLAFLGLAVVYFLQSYFVSQKIGVENMKKDEDLKNIFYSLIGISISLFSIAIAFVFSNHPEIISTTWLFEATILYYFYSKNSSKKVFIAGTILFLIGLTKFGILVDVVQKKEFLFLISFAVILASFILNLFFINSAKKENNTLKIIHNILHLIGMGIMGLLLLKIIPSSGHGWSQFGISIFISFLGIFYAKFNFNFLKYTFLILIGLFSFSHFSSFGPIIGKLSTDKMSYLKVLQYIVSLVIISNIFIWKKYNLDLKINGILRKIIGIYTFFITSLFFYEIFDSILGHFSLTIFWGFIASSFFIYGVQKDIIKFRTIGLYFLILTSAKIFLFDVWQIGSTNGRVVTFAILGVIFIIISQLYTKKYGDNLSGEFSLKNLR